MKCECCEMAPMTTDGGGPENCDCSGALVRHEHGEFAPMAALHYWEPVWTYDGPAGRFAFTIDDHCYIALYLDETGCWEPMQHIPVRLVEEMAKHAAGVAA